MNKDKIVSVELYHNSPLAEIYNLTFEQGLTVLDSVGITVDKNEFAHWLLDGYIDGILVRTDRHALEWRVSEDSINQFIYQVIDEINSDEEERVLSLQKIINHLYIKKHVLSEGEDIDLPF